MNSKFRAFFFQEDYTYDNADIGRAIFEEMAEVKFVGISVRKFQIIFFYFLMFFSCGNQGEVAFNQQTGDRIAWTKVEQLQDGAYVEVALHDQRTDNLTW